MSIKIDNNNSCFLVCSKNEKILQEYSLKRQYYDKNGKMHFRKVFVHDVNGLDIFEPFRNKYDYSTISLDRFCCLDTFTNNETLNTYLVAESGFDCPKKLLLWIPSPTQTSTVNIEKVWKPFHQAMEKSRKIKKSVKRGKHKGEISDFYMCFGYRTDRKNGTVGEYVYQKSKDADVQKQTIDDAVNKLVHVLEKLTKPFFDTISYYEEFVEILTEFGVPTMVQGGLYVTLCVGSEYGSPWHTDSDYFYTTTAVHNPNIADQKTVLYHLCINEYGIKVPLYNYSVVVFDSENAHCVSNPIVKDSYILSCYVSAKTFNSKMSEYTKKRNK